MFVETVEKALITRFSWPQIVIAVGQDSDCVDTLVERFYVKELPSVLDRAKLRHEIIPKLLEWPRDDHEDATPRDSEEQIRGLQKAVAQSLELPRSASRERIVRELSAQNGAIFFHFDIDGEKYDARRHQELIRALEWWAGLSAEISTPYPVVVMPWFSLRRNGPFGLLGRSRMKRLSSKLLAIAASDGFRNRLTVLPPLGMVTHRDAIDWLNENKGDAAEQPADYAIKLAEFFSSWFGFGRSVTMTEASGFFSMLIGQMDISPTPLVTGKRQP
ncbi:hypothetical protein ACC756_28005 [Rhizobium ruizarguesonis]